MADHDEKCLVKRQTKSPACQLNMQLQRAYSAPDASLVMNRMLLCVDGQKQPDRSKIPMLMLSGMSSRRSRSSDRLEPACADLAPTRRMGEVSERSAKNLTMALFLCSDFRSFQPFIANLIFSSNSSPVKLIIFLSAQQPRTFRRSRYQPGLRAGVPCRQEVGSM